MLSSRLYARLILGAFILGAFLVARGQDERALAMLPKAMRRSRTTLPPSASSANSKAMEMEAAEEVPPNGVLYIIVPKSV